MAQVFKDLLETARQNSQEGGEEGEGGAPSEEERQRTASQHAEKNEGGSQEEGDPIQVEEADAMQDKENRNPNSNIESWAAPKTPKSKKRTREPMGTPVQSNQQRTGEGSQPMIQSDTNGNNLQLLRDITEAQVGENKEATIDAMMKLRGSTPTREETIQKD